MVRHHLIIAPRAEFSPPALPFLTGLEPIENRPPKTGADERSGNRLKTVEFPLCGTTYHLCLNGAALFDCFDHFETGTDFIEKISGEDKESFEATCWCLEKFSQQGAIVRRWESMGAEKTPMLPAQKAAALLRPADVIRAREAIREAFHLGFAREEEREDEEIDLGWLELQKKTEND